MLLNALITGRPRCLKASGFRSAIHFVLFLLCLYFGFIRAPSQN